MGTQASSVTITTTVQAPIEKVWRYWNDPVHIVNWNNASDDWHTPAAENVFKTGGTFRYTMAARDGSFQFDFSGTYTEIIEHELVAYEIEDGRKVEISFEDQDDTVQITEIFETENQNPVEMQREGWQAILDNFRQYTQNN